MLTGPSNSVANMAVIDAVYLAAGLPIRPWPGRTRRHRELLRKDVSMDLRALDENLWFLDSLAGRG